MHPGWRNGCCWSKNRHMAVSLTSHNFVPHFDSIYPFHVYSFSLLFVFLSLLLVFCLLLHSLPSILSLFYIYLLPVSPLLFFFLTWLPPHLAVLSSCSPFFFPSSAIIYDQLSLSGRLDAIHNPEPNFEFTLYILDQREWMLMWNP